METIAFRATEAGLRLLRTTLRNYERTASLAAVLPGRIRKTELGTTDPRELAAQSAFLRLVSVTEATVDSLGVEATAESVPAVDEAVRLLMLEKELASSSSWEGRKRSFRRHHKVRLANCDEFKSIQGAIEVRNAIAHGLGSLTTRQLVSAETRPRLKRIDVQIVNGFVSLRTGHVSGCASYSAVFLRSLDGVLGARR